MEHVKLSIKGIAFASSVTWGLTVLFVGTINLVRPGYGSMFLGLVSSVYPGYHADPTIASVIVGTLYALLDGAIGGAIFAWFYNVCNSSSKK